MPLSTAKEIETAMRRYRRDQPAIIHQMAAERGLDPRHLTPRQYARLLREEAAISVKTALPEDLAFEKRYAADLRALAARITP